VGIFMERSPEMIVALLGVLKAGAAYVPLDPDYPAERLAFMINGTRAAMCLTQQRHLPNFPTVCAEIVCLDTDGKIAAEEYVENPVTGVTPENPAYIIYTSGSTGTPKGVEIRHAGLTNLVKWHQRVYGPRSGDRATQLTSPAFDASVWETWPYLAAGASIHVPDEETRRSPSILLNWLARSAITICFLPTPLAEAILEEQLPTALALRFLLTGGDKLRHRPRRALPFRLVNHYGPTETTVVATCAPVESGEGLSVSPPIGRPIDNSQVYIVDRSFNSVPVGVPGELCIAGDGLARGYLNHSDLTAEKFVPNPFSDRPGERLYRAGDLARRLSDGNIEFLGRIDHQVKVRGYRIEPGEIEAALRGHPQVSEAVVLAREDPPGNKRLVGYVVSRERAGIGDLRNFLSHKLPDYMVPSAFVFMESLPLTSNGKIDRGALPVPEQVRPELESAFVAPRTPTERALAKTWAEILKLERIGIGDNFFELGGHSLLATQVISRVRDAFEIELPLRSLFENPTVAGLAQRIEVLLWAGKNNQLPCGFKARDREEIKL
jgi:amino acid adenylation domain-containing protein